MCRSDIGTTASTKMKVVLLAHLVVSASAMTSGVSSSRMQNPSNVNERSYNIRLRGLEKRHKEHTSDHAEVIAKETEALDFTSHSLLDRNRNGNRSHRSGPARSTVRNGNRTHPIGACSIDRWLDIKFDALTFLSNNNNEFPCPQHPGRRQRNEPLH
jgi:hypothetical protein